MVFLELLDQQKRFCLRFVGKLVRRGFAFNYRRYRLLSRGQWLGFVEPALQFPSPGFGSGDFGFPSCNPCQRSRGCREPSEHQDTIPNMQCLKIPVLCFHWTEASIDRKMMCGDGDSIFELFDQLDRDNKKLGNINKHVDVMQNQKNSL